MIRSFVVHQYFTLRAETNNDSPTRLNWIYILNIIDTKEQPDVLKKICSKIYWRAILATNIDSENKYNHSMQFISCKDKDEIVFL